MSYNQWAPCAWANYETKPFGNKGTRPGGSGFDRVRRRVVTALWLALAVAVSTLPADAASASRSITAPKTGASTSPSIAEAVDAPQLAWTTGGDASWVGQTTNTYDGLDAAQSGNIIRNQESWIETTVEGPGTLSFTWSVSSETGYDLLGFKTNGVLVRQISGDVGWTTVSWPIGSGTQVLRWTYSKDEDIDGNLDRGWVDYVRFESDRPTPPAILTQPQDSCVVLGLPATFSVEAIGSAPLCYQWQKEGIAIAGATNSEYTIAAMRSADAGNYSVLVSNALGSVASSDAVLTARELLGDTFQIRSLDTNNSLVIDHDAVTGDDRGGIAISGERVFYTGDQATGSFRVDDLGDGTALDAIHDSLVSDLRTQLIYSLGDGTNEIGEDGGTVTTLIELDGETLQPTGVTVTLSQPVEMGTGGIFSGFGRIALWNGIRAYDISLPSGVVTDLGDLELPAYQLSENWAIWGVEEFVEGHINLVYVRDDQSIVRTQVPGGQTTLVGTYDSLSDMASFTVSLSRNRWYFHHESTSQFGGKDETLGYADASFDVALTPSAPVIARQPQDIVAEIGRTAMLRVVVIGTSPYTYQWSKDGVSLDGATNCPLILEGVQPSDAGSYSVIVSNALGWVASSNAVVTVRALTLGDAVDAPELTWTTGGDSPWIGQHVTTSDESDAAQSGPVSEGQESWIQTTVQGPGTVSYTWKISSENESDFVEFRVNGEQMMYASANMDWDTEVTWVDSGPQTLQWRLVKSSGGFSDQDQAWLDGVSYVPDPVTEPSITMQPRSQAVPLGAAAALRVEADGTSPLNYQWEKDGNAIEGATDPVYTIAQMGLNDAGDYSVVVSNSAGWVRSSVAVLTATATVALDNAVDASELTWRTGGDAPWAGETSDSWDGTDAAQSGLIYDDQVSWIETTVEGPGMVHYAWKVSSEAGCDLLRFAIDGVFATEISGDVDWTTITNLVGAGTHTLRWSYTKDGSVDDGLDRAWLDQVRFVPYTPAPPSIVSQPQSQTVALGSAVSLGVSVFSVEPLQYQWFKEGIAIARATNALYTIAAMRDVDAGTYSVVVSNWEGAVTSSNAVLTLIPGATLGDAVDAPELTWSTGGSAAWIGQSAISYDGVDAAQSGAITASQETWMETTVQGPGTLSFAWRVSSESGCDFLQFRTNGTMLNQISGTVLWSMVTNRIAGGTQTLRWRYYKDASVDTGMDRGWVDQVRFVADAPSAPSIVAQPQTRQALLGSTATLSVGALGTAPLSYQWQKWGTAIPGATNFYYTIRNVRTNDAGTYSVTVSNSMGWVTSSNAELTILELTGETFQIVDLLTNNSRVIDHDVLTGDDRGGIAASSTDLFYSGDSATARFSLEDLSNGAGLGRVYDGLLSDLKTEQVYSLGNGTNLLGSVGGTVTSLIALDGHTLQTTGARIELSQPVVMTRGGIFSGFGRVILWNGSRVYNIALPSGVVTDLGDLVLPSYQNSESWAIWGVAEFWNGIPSLVYVRDRQTIVRTSLSDQTTSVVETFANLSDMASFTVSLSRNRWYFHHESFSQFGGVSETIGYADASFDYLQVPSAPSVVRQPQSTTVLAGSALTLSVVAAGDRPIYYQWWKDGQILSGATNGSYTIASAQTNHAGSYSVIVSNSLGWVSSSNAVITVLPMLALGDAVDAPELTWTTGGVAPWSGQLTNTADGIDAAQSGLIGVSQTTWMQTVVQGPGTLTFSWAISSQPGWDYLWFRTNGISVAQISGLVAWCSVTNRIAAGPQVLEWSYTKESPVAWGTGQGWVDRVSFVPDPPSAPTILSQPRNRMAVIGTAASFNVGASGTGPLGYQWRKEGVAIGGATNASYTISAVGTNDTGAYSVTVSNYLGSVTSSNAVLTLVELTDSAFQISGLFTNNSRVIEHNPLTGDDRGGIAASADDLFYSGDTATARFSLEDLSGGTSLGRIYDGLASDLKTEQVYSLGYGTNLLSSWGGTITSLIELDGRTLGPTGTSIDLSQPVTMTRGGIFSGFGRIVLWNESRVYDIALPSGLVTDLGPLTLSTYQGSETWAIWGVAEFWEGEINLVYVRDRQTIARTRVSDGLTTTVGTFRDLADMASFTVSISRNRWYFHHEGPSQFGGSSETIGYADASFVYSLTPTAPTIVRQPQSSAVYAGATVGLSVSVNGTTPLFYQWMKDGVNIVGANGPNYTIANVWTNQSGSYSVIVSNSLGWVVSSNAVLTVAPALTLGEAVNAPELVWNTGGSRLWVGEVTNSYDGVAAAQSGPITAGQETWMETTVQGPGTLSFTWKVSSEAGCDYLQFRTNGILVTQMAGYAGWTTVTNRIAAGSQTLRWRYSKDGSVDSGADRGWVDRVSFVADPPSAPSIASQPVNRSVIAGSTATFSVSAVGTDPLSYQWQKDGTAISGATNSSYVIRNIRTNDAGLYSVTVSNALGWASSSNALLTVIALTGDTFQINGLFTNNSRVIDHDALTGDDRGGIAASGTNLFYTGDGATARFSLDDLSGGTSMGRIYDALASDLRTEQVYSLGNGNFQIGTGGLVTTLIALDGGTLQPTGDLIVLSQPVTMMRGAGIFSGFGRIVLWTGSRVYDIELPSGRVTDLGDFTLWNYQGSENWAIWGVAEFFGGDLYLDYVHDSQTIVRTRVADGSTTVVGSFRYLSDMASFTVSLSRNRWYFHHEYSSEFGGISETLGYADASFSFLTAPWAPVIRTQPMDVAATLGAAANFSVLAWGSDPLSFQWRKDGVNIVDATNSVLALSDLRPRDGGGYSVVVTNSMGSATSRIAMLVLPEPVLHHFNWSQQPASTQYQNRPFPVALTAEDILGNVVTRFSGRVSFAGLAPSGVVTNSILGSPAHASTYSDSFTLGYAFTPNTNLVVTHVRSYSGTKVSIWTDAGDLLVAQSVNGPSGTWTDTEIPAPITLAAGRTYRVGFYSGGGAYYWNTSRPSTFPDGTLVNGYYYTASDSFPTSLVTGDKVLFLCDLRYTVMTSTLVPVTPTAAEGFVNGVWTGNVAVLQAVTNVMLQVDDGAGHLGLSRSFQVNGSNTAPPMITAQPQNRCVEMGGDATLTVSATGASPLIYQWWCNGERLVETTNALLTICQVRPAQTGRYFVIVTNDYGSATSEPAMLTLPQAALVSKPMERGRFQFTLTGEAGQRYDVQASTNLVDWFSIGASTNSTGTSEFGDAVGNSRQRFYRLQLRVP